MLKILSCTQRLYYLHPSVILYTETTNLICFEFENISKPVKNKTFNFFYRNSHHFSAIVDWQEGNVCYITRI